MNEDQNQNTNPDSDAADRISKELQISLPGKNLPAPIRLITFFTLIIGLSVIGSMFDEIVRPEGGNPLLYFLRISIGFLAVTIAYGIIEKQRWALWLYGLLALIAFFTNPFLAFIPSIAVVYLYTKRELFTPSFFDHLSEKFIFWIQTLLHRNNPPSSF